MDRRDFLKTTGAAAVAAGAAGASARATDEAIEGAVQSPAVLAGTRVLALANDYAAGLPGLGAERLARRIEAASDGRFRIELADGAADAELTYGLAARHASLHPAFAFFAGLPFGQGLDVPDHHTWLAAAGGEMLWDELAAAFDFKPLVAGHTGASSGVWAGARLEQASDLTDARLHAVGLAADVLRALGAIPVVMPAHEVRAALAGGDIRAAEWLGPLAAASPDLQPIAQRVYEPGFHQAGMVLSLAVARGTWSGMTASDRALFEACAAQEYVQSIADARMHAMIAGQLEAPAKWPVRLALPAALAEALDAALAEAVERIAAADPAAGRIHDSYRAFRGLLHEDLFA